MVQLIKKFKNLTITAQGLITLLSVGLYFLTSYFLEKSYVLSKFPVPYFEQQTSFDAIKMKDWYAFMVQEGTFGIYLKTQFIDFAFIVTVILAGFTLWTFISNLHPKGAFFNKWGYKFAFSLPLAGIFDVLENIVSFFMISQPENFSNFLVFPYSLFAVIKFGFWFIGLFWVIISLLALPIVRFRFFKN